MSVGMAGAQGGPANSKEIDELLEGYHIVLRQVDEKRCYVP